GFRGKPITFTAAVGGLIGIISERFPQGEGRWTPSRQSGPLESGGTPIAHEKAAHGMCPPELCARQPWTRPLYTSSAADWTHNILPQDAMISSISLEKGDHRVRTLLYPPCHHRPDP